MIRNIVRRDFLNKLDIKTPSLPAKSAWVRATWAEPCKKHAISICHKQTTKIRRKNVPGQTGAGPLPDGKMTGAEAGLLRKIKWRPPPKYIPVQSSFRQLSEKMYTCANIFA
jgi:hypothetical protein